MKIKRIHGRLLILTGAVHIAVTLLPGVFGEQFAGFFGKAFFNISRGIASFPLFGGSHEHAVFAAFWFFYMGPVLIVCGLLLDYIERFRQSIPLYLVVGITTVVLMGVYMIPISGMTILLLPQAVYMICRSMRFYKIQEEE